jgi:hypothetical protein
MDQHMGRCRAWKAMNLAPDRRRELVDRTQNLGQRSMMTTLW